MATYSVADAKNALPRLIDSALAGEEVIITRHGKSVAELRPVSASPPNAAGTYAWLRDRRRSRSRVGLTSVEILDRMYEPEGR
ncbi:MAG TPA: type II toxin-antitoxin system prevent-host-death family antitoxin [Rhizomicrobium sp.]|jgi:prevent-host-death family protein|nr:type II toxin-antitoxin system prevent-host-death family antitoxin [Rhizomicrobium sp.]